ncbi:aminotransferase class IV, partial [bacterium]|nr:aminotransferase class IV [bacterium]
NVFEGIRAYLGEDGIVKPFLLDQHLSRLATSARLMRLDQGLDVSMIRKDVLKLLKVEAPKTDIYIKIIVFTNSDGGWTYTGPVDTCVFYYEMKSALRNNVPASVEGRICSFTRIGANVNSPKVKAGANYMNSRLGYLDVNFGMMPQKPVVPVFLNKDGNISETSGSCLFIVSENKVVTPNLNSSILPSITRKELLNHLSACDPELNVIEETVDRWDLYNAKEVFVCGTNVEVASMVEVDSYRIADGNVGQVTMRVFEYLKKAVT